jgi:hypothetical protein
MIGMVGIPSRIRCYRLGTFQLRARVQLARKPRFSSRPAARLSPAFKQLARSKVAGTFGSRSQPIILGLARNDCGRRQMLARGLHLRPAVGDEVLVFSGAVRKAEVADLQELPVDPDHTELFQEPAPTARARTRGSALGARSSLHPHAGISRAKRARPISLPRGSKTTI